MRILAIGPATLVLAAGLASAQTETIEESFTVSGTPTIQVRNEDGRTEISSHGGDTVVVRVEKEIVRAGSEAEAERVAREVEVRIEQTGDRIDVETRYPQRHWTFWRDVQVLVHIDVKAPRRSNVDAAAEDGRLEVTGFEGELRLRSEDGDVLVSDCSGAIDLTAEDGDVRVLGFRGDVRAEVEDGDLRIEGALGGLRAEAEDGDIEVRLAPDSAMKQDWSVRAQDGRVRLEFPSRFAADLDVHTNDGSIRIDLPVTVSSEVSKGRLVTELNGGGYRLAIRTEDGSVRLLESS